VTPDGPARRQLEDTTAARLAEIVAAAEQAAKGVIDEAEAEARERLADANVEADRIVAERLDRLAGLTAELDAQAEALKRGAEALRAALAEARAELGGGGESLGGSRLMRDFAPEADPAPQLEPERPKGPSLTVVGGVDPVVPPSVDPTASPSREDGAAASSEPSREASAPDPKPFRGRFAMPGFDSVSRERPAAPGPDLDPATTGTPAGARLLATQMAVSGSSREEIEQRLRSGFAVADTTAILDAILGPER